jgi:hypothetical protein
VLLQAANIAYAWFKTLSDIDGGAVIDNNYEGNAGHALHGIIGIMIIPAVALIFLIVSFFAKIPGGVKWAAIIFGLVVLQVALAFASFAAPIVGTLHGINALALIALAGFAGRRAMPGAPAAGFAAGEPAQTTTTRA